MCMYLCVHKAQHAGGSQDNLWELVLSPFIMQVLQLNLAASTFT